MRLDVLTGALDDEFGTRLVQDDDWADVFEQCYPDPYWREFAEPGWEGRWNGLMVRGSGEVARAVAGLASHQRPKRFVPITDWPRNAQGKINLVQLRRIIRETSSCDELSQT